MENNYEGIEDIIPEGMAEYMLDSISRDYERLRTSPMSWGEFLGSLVGRKNEDYAKAVQSHFEKLLLIWEHPKVRNEENKQLYEDLSSLTKRMVDDLIQNYGFNREELLKSKKSNFHKFTERKDY